MFSLRALLAPRPVKRCFALLDAQGICRALRHSAQAPQGLGWVEVETMGLHWLDQRLPAHVRISAQQSPAFRPKALTA
ncbi:hypothetical protein [Pseudomonas xionganensis]|uniref:Uncharacterized protein n=1 Tax=Pseudomonas xionganensis TaxID=2654845 RepID=A0A6I4KRZ1_9PSED|nr:hypothetical protein [Pseudomonas xionganensis]MVW74877.1 hypothetical protein [Pseudomonas xionganensis]